MKQMLKCVTTLFLVILLYSCTNRVTNGLDATSLEDDVEQVIHHEGFSLLYSEQHEQARWIAYTLSSDEVYGSVARKDKYRSDPEVISGSAELSDYKYSGYDRGHLKPAADSKISDKEMLDCSFLTNISPQMHSFNAGIWVKLEKKMREWAVAHDSIHIVTGPVLNAPLGVIGDNEVSIPEAFYKAIMSADSSRSIAFLLPHADSDDDLSTFVITVDSLETVTDLNFFIGANESIESSTLLSSWE